MSTKITVEVVCAEPRKQRLVELRLEPGTTARRALLDSGLQDEFPDFDLATCPLGVWGKVVDDAYVPGDGARIEAYRALIIDPREARRELARTGRSIAQARKT